MFNSLKLAAVRTARITSFGLGLALLLAATAPAAHAALADAPEVDPGSLASVATLLVGGVMTLTGRIRRQK